MRDLGDVEGAGLALVFCGSTLVMLGRFWGPPAGLWTLGSATGALATAAVLLSLGPLRAEYRRRGTIGAVQYTAVVGLMLASLLLLSFWVARTVLS
jgi:hypothetical protein